MVDYTFGDNTITGLPAGSSNVASLTYNPFADVTVIDGTSNEVRVRLALTNGTGDGAISNGTLVTSTGTITVGQTINFQGTAAQVEAWLESAFMISDPLDVTRITLRGYNTANTGVGGTSNLAMDFVQTACYVRGTLIGTPAGQRPVEDLRIGDMVTTLDGSAKPVKWVGHRTYEAAFGAAEPTVRPVLLRAGSLGDNQPVRDLRVSPQHAMLVDGVMVPAASLVNSVTILREAAPADIQYFHIELDGHEAVFAEGAPAETFVDANSRAMFDNADEYALLYGTTETAATLAAPRVEEGYQLEAIRRRLSRIAGIAATAGAPGALAGNIERIEDGVLHGWIADTANAAEPVEADVLVDGEVVARVLANRYRADLDKAGFANGNCAFTVAVPPSAASVDQVTLRRVTDGATLGAFAASFTAAV